MALRINGNLRRVSALGAAALAMGTLGSSAHAAFDAYALAPSYVRSLDPHADFSPIVTVGSKLKLTGDAGQSYLLDGIPDGLGLYTNRFGLPILPVNHEFNSGEGTEAGPLPKGSRVSELVLDADGDKVVSASDLIQNVYEVLTANDIDGDQYALDPSPAAFTRFCSAFLADAEVGFDRPIWLTGEESTSSPHSPAGPSATATVGQSLYLLPRLGHAAYENLVAVPGTGQKTVVFGMEDGPSGYRSQLYMYVGTKLAWSADPLAANGLSNGQLYVFCGDNAAANDEASFATKGGSIAGHGAPLDYTLDANGLEAAAQAAGAFGFYRIEDGCAHPNQPGAFFFDTTGGGGANPYGRIYRLNFDTAYPTTGSTHLTILLDGSEGIVSPDNLDLNKEGELAILEDPNYDLAGDLGLTRDSSVWVYDTKNGDLKRIGEIDRSAAIAHAMWADPANQNIAGEDHPGGWESSGIIDAEAMYGRGAWLFDVQAYSLRINPIDQTVQGGQILMLRYVPESRPRMNPWWCNWFGNFGWGRGNDDHGRR